MDPVPAGDTSSDTVRARRKRMRAQARALHPATSPKSEVFETPQWLERSFVLPLTKPVATDVPSQPTPHHDDYEPEPGPEPETVESTTPEPGQAPVPAPAFVRPADREIDFARVMWRSDLSRTSTRAVLGSTGLVGLVLIAYLLTSSRVVLGMAIAFSLMAVVAVVVRVRCATSSISYVER